jgi:uncharacterized Zn finger protein
VHGGLRLRSPDAPQARTWPAKRFLSLLEELIAPPQLREGLQYARRGQTVRLEIAPGRIDGEVQGRTARPYRTAWLLPVPGDEPWARVVASMAQEAFYEAKLRAGELPAALGRLMESLGVAVLPVRGDVELRCDCGAAGPCKHAAALGYLVTERLDNEPLTLFTLRGMAGILERLARARVLRPGAGPPARVETEAALDAAALREGVGAFWRPGPRLSDLGRMPPPQHAPHALLRRMGPSPLPGRFPLVGLLASVYDEVAAWAVRLRDRAERLEE